MEYILREFRPSDAPHIAKFANNPKIAQNLRDGFPHPYALEDAQSFIQLCIENEDKQLLRAIEIDGMAVGNIGLFFQTDVYKKSAELGYWLAEPYWGKGVITAAIKELCAQAFQAYDIVRIYAEPYAYNAGSRKALEKAGFLLEGTLKSSVFKNGVLYDSCIYALLK